MDNLTSDPFLKLPSVPASFEATAGNSRVDFAKALFALLESASIGGITDDDPSEFDFGSLQAKVNSLEKLFNQAVRKVRRVTMNGAADATILTPIFDDIGTLDYSVNLVFLIPPSTPGGGVVSWFLVEGSKQTDRCQIQLEGNSAGFKCEISIVADEQ